MNRDKLLNQLTMLDFIAVDLALYLNTHPDDCETIEMYNAVIDEADKLRSFYEENLSPLYSFRSNSDENFFSWIDKPMPPSYCFNWNPQKFCQTGQNNTALSDTETSNRSCKERKCY